MKQKIHKSLWQSVSLLIGHTPLSNYELNYVYNPLKKIRYLDVIYAELNQVIAKLVHY